MVLDEIVIEGLNVVLDALPIDGLEVVIGK